MAPRDAESERERRLKAAAEREEQLREAAEREQRINAAIDAALDVKAGDRERVLLDMLSDESERSAARRILRGLVEMPANYLEEPLDVPTLLIGTPSERSAPDPFGPGDIIASRFRLEERLGRGASGLVFRARDESSADAIVAIKIFVDAQDEALRREITALQKLRLPGVVHIVETGHFAGLPYCAMEFVAGSPFPGPGIKCWNTLRSRALRLIEIVAAMHARGVVHGDLKPHNVLVDGERVVVLDLGIASGPSIAPEDQRVRSVGGTLGYMPPEQFHSRPKKASDLYALGIMIVEALGLSPDRIEKEVSVFERVKLGTRIDLPDDVRTLIEELLVADLSQRPSDALELWRSLGGRRGMLESPIPWLGSQDSLEQAVASLTQGKSFVVAGPSGSGRTRFLEEVALRLRERGNEFAIIHGRDQSPDLRAHVQAAVTVLVDDSEHLPRDLLEQIATKPRLEMRVLSETIDKTQRLSPIDATLEPLSEPELELLFAGRNASFICRAMLRTCCIEKARDCPRTLRARSETGSTTD